MATLTLDTESLKIGKVQTVEVFGEFTDKEREGAWGKKIKCQKIDHSTFSVNVKIRIGQQFKFIVDSGRTYAVSPEYL